jgi:hypothetical protein
MKTILPDSQQSLVQWVSQATGISTFGVKVRLQGNNLHILCEGLECPQRWRTLSDLLRALQQTNLDILTSTGQVSIYQVFVYGRKKGENRPKWCHRVYLNQLDRHLEQVQSALIKDAKKPRLTGGALIVSNESLARQGDPNAIAHYLSETLSTLGVSVNVQVKKQQPTVNNQDIQSRLWIFCQSSYSPDPSLIADVIAKKLRELKLSGYQDAVIASQVNGENTPDWLLRIDLTPPEVMLKEWARWGDLQAIAQLLTEALLESKVAVETTLKESTLHIFCTPAFDFLGNAPAPDQALCLKVITPLLQFIAPQGIVQATVYGQKTGDVQPGWIDWLFLPASEHPALVTTPLELAVSGDEGALIFLLERLLNPDLDSRLMTGGIRVLLLRRGDLLHIMCDAPICPGRRQVAPKVIDFVSQLKISEIKGVRVYGRRAGNKEPFWHDGIDFEQRQQLVSDATPEFAATSAYIRELLPSENSEPVLRSDVTPEEIHTFVLEVAQDWRTKVRNFLLGTQLFVDTQQPSAPIPNHQGRLIALVWGALGLLLTLQTDWVLGKLLTKTTGPTPTIESVLPNSSRAKSTFVPHSSLAKSSTGKSFVFNASEFTQIDDSQITDLKAAPLKQKATSTAILLAARAQIPSFNTRQLEEQLALYKQRLLTRGKPPNVLIIGSSRALRGIDPAELSQTLATQGYSNVDVFNFGINGATAQVVDFVLRQVLKPSELPKLILWGDGSRAFNNGREDITFKAIAASQGYKQLSPKAPSTASHVGVSSSVQTPGDEKTNSYQRFNHLLNTALATVSATYQHRDNLKNLLNQKLKSWSIIGNDSPVVHTKANLETDTSTDAVDFDGFLPLSIRFQPEIYYQKHPKVSGDYDNDYKDFQLTGEQDAALHSIIEFAQSQKISLVFVNLPLTADYLDPVRSKYEQEFQDYMLSLANQPNFIYRDLSQLWPKANDYFSDPSHLNRYGAYKVSQKLANDPMIPWPSK